MIVFSKHFSLKNLPFVPSPIWTNSMFKQSQLFFFGGHVRLIVGVQLQLAQAGPKLRTSSPWAQRQAEAYVQTRRALHGREEYLRCGLGPDSKARELESRPWHPKPKPRPQYWSWSLATAPAMVSIFLNLLNFYKNYYYLNWFFSLFSFLIVLIYLICWK